MPRWVVFDAYGDSIEVTNYFDLAIDVHHIFPKAYCEKQGYSRGLWNSSLNKAPLSAKTNRIIGGRAPSIYLAKLEQDHRIPADRVDEILRTHQINPSLLRANAFEEFLRDRAARLLDLIEQAMGKTLLGRDSDEIIREFGAPLAPSAIRLTDC